jgi:hypothetical protein
MASVPGSLESFKTATTALCVMALREAGEHSAHDKGLAYIVTHADNRRDTGMLIYNIWANMYCLQAMALELRDNPDPAMQVAAQNQIKKLEQYETHVGGWNYYDFLAHTEHVSLGPTSFNTATGLVALWEARKSGLAVPQPMVDRALHRLAGMQLPDGTYLYDEDLKYAPRMPVNRSRGASGRTQACNYARWLWNEPKVGLDEALRGLAILDRDQDWLKFGRKRPWPHESWYQVSGYFYYYGLYYGGQLLDRLPEPQHAKYSQLLQDMILPYQEPDGSWWDYTMWDFHKPYGTAYALMTLMRCSKPAPSENH